MDLLRRSSIAMIVAYAVALQVLLSGWIPLAPTVLGNANPLAVAVICLHDGPNGAGQPISHDLPCTAVCAALGHAVTGPLPPAVSVAIVSARVLAAVAPDSERTSSHRASRTPQVPRGPPLT